MSKLYPDQYRTHETAADRARQRLQFEHYAQHTGMTFKIIELKHSRQDGLFFRNGIYVVRAEAKYRFTPQSAHPDFTTDVSKLEALEMRAFQDIVDPLLLVSWQGDDHFCYLPADWRDWPQTWQPSRRDRREKSDLVSHAPLHLFEKVVY